VLTGARNLVAIVVVALGAALFAIAFREAERVTFTSLVPSATVPAAVCLPYAAVRPYSTR
jgi:hypothetical protein